jgi:ADP-L-glycero-D-manno-heptose 6-epimerase
MIIVTGGAGFIGSNVVHELNRIGESDILVVDNLSSAASNSPPKFLNLAGASFADFMDKREFRSSLAAGKFSSAKIRAILHNGACSNTLEDDGRYMLDNNFTCSKEVLRYAVENAVPLVYASTAAVYGLSKLSAESEEHERPLNIYGFSKLVFDNYLRRLLPSLRSTVVGLRYFNVYGPREAHKGRMASVIHHFSGQLREWGKIRMFEGSGGYGPGEQRRDFVFVRDLARMNLHFAGLTGKAPSVQGIFNAGTGRSRSFNDVARALMQSIQPGTIEYIPFPPDLENRYQHFTEADVTRLREAGWEEEFTSLEDGIRETTMAAQPA